MSCPNRADLVAEPGAAACGCSRSLPCIISPGLSSFYAPGLDFLSWGGRAPGPAGAEIPTLHPTGFSPGRYAPLNIALQLAA